MFVLVFNCETVGQSFERQFKLNRGSKRSSPAGDGLSTPYRLPVAYSNLVSAPVPLGLILTWVLGIGFWGFGNRVLGPGLDNLLEMFLNCETFK